jgi:hypothetical protein
MRAFLVAGLATALMAAGCGAAPPPRADKHSSKPASAKLTGLRACHRLMADVTHNHGVPDISTLRLIADHVTVPRIAADARTAVRDIEHTGVAPVALTLLRSDCAQTGVKIPAPSAQGTPGPTVIHATPIPAT